LPIFIGPQSSSQLRSSVPGVAYRAPLLGGEQGTAQTIHLMRKLVDEAQADAGFVRLAMDIVHSVPAHDEIAEMQALYNWVKRNIRFTKDPVSKEKLYPPQEVLKTKAGDCDDISMLLGALLLSVGYPARLITVSANAQNPEQFSHVYVEGEAPPHSGNWIAMDAARLDSQFGLEPPRYFRKRAWSLTDDTFQDLHGFGFLGSYGTVDAMGDWSDISWGDIIQQSVQEIPAIISTARGGSSTLRLPGQYGGTVATGPYASFATPYTPGYGVPTAGYGASGQFSASGFGSMMPWIIGAVVLLGVLGMGGRR
jgi:hypothetical protein